ncbi:flippase [Dictyobacter alpinus]|uniref:Flippase n=1 Tax=Dictyobacter alpinus TaxID=2014873 RepID=A0A402B6L5_9CHLR|nr:polysaccharide biosynthesis C-terminal domain-containing protein [Dictyobacter alpinus]GCE26984.1 flippase [Dictyobacter alpinus]
MVGGRDMAAAQSYAIRDKHSAPTKRNHTRIWKNSVLTGSMLINVSIYILIARSLGPHVFGSYLFAQWLASVTIPMLGTGMSTLASRQIAETQSRESPRLMAGIFYFLWYRQHRSILWYCLAYLLLSFVLTHIFHDFSPGLLLLSCLATLPLLLSSVAGITLRSLRRSDLLIMLNLFGHLLTLLFILISTQINEEPVESFILAFTLSHTITLVLAVICVVSLLPLEQALAPGIFLKERLIHNMHLSRLHFALDAIVWQRSELLLLAFWHNSEVLGFYALSAIISTRIIGLAPALFSQWIFPLVIRYLPRHRYLNQYDAFVKTSCYIIFLAVPICTVMILLCPHILALFFGSAYLPMVKPLRILLIAAVFGSIATVGLTHMASQEQHDMQHIQRIQQEFNLGVACLKIVLALPLVLLWGMVGAAIASTLAQIFSAVISILLCKKLLMRHEKLL